MRKKFFLKSMLTLSAFGVTMGLSAQNPVIHTMFTPDPAPYVHGDTLYLFVDHDEDDAQYFKMKDWLLYCTTDMVNWTYLGTQVSTATFKWAKQGDRAWASQAVERNGKWYWYVCCNTAKGGDALAVAVADNPQGPWTDAIGAPLAEGFSFIDPTIFIDNDGRAYLFWGNKGCWYGELNDDMISFKDGWKEVPGFHDPACFGPESMKTNWAKGGKEEMMVGYEEGPWVTRKGNTYFMTYPSGGVPEHMAYSTAPTIDGPWTYRGRIMDEAQNSFTIHGGQVTYKGHNYMFYHNGALPGGGGFRRSTCVEEFKYNADGSIPFIPFTKEGVAPLGTLNPYLRVEAETMASASGLKNDSRDGVNHYVTSIDNGDWLKVREVDFGKKSPVRATVAVADFKNSAAIEFYADNMDGAPICTIDIKDGQAVQKARVKTKLTGVHDVYIRFTGGEGHFFDFDWWQFK